MLKWTGEAPRVPIDKIVVGIRRRRKLGGLRSLAKSIERRNLLHPILLRNGNELVAGHRRLEACKLLGWTSIPARFVEDLAEAEFRAVELEENTERIAYADFDLSKRRDAEIRQAKADLEAEPELLPKLGKNPKGGRPKKRTARRAVAEVTGLSRSNQERTERHVEVADRYPVFQRPDWKEHNVLEAAEALEQLPEQARSQVAALLDQDGIPPKKAIEIITHVAEMKPAERQAVFDLATSDDPFDRRVALTKAADVPPPPDPAVGLLRRMRRLGERAAKECRIDRLRPRINGLVKEAAGLIRQFDDEHKGG